MAGRACLYQDDITMILSGSQKIYTLNNSGQIVGFANTTNDAASYATVWNGTTANALPLTT